MDADKRAELDKKLAQLRDYYIQSLPGEFEKLDAKLTELQPNVPAREIISDIHQALHKFAGSGGSFGFHELSADARSIEQDLLKWLKADKNYYSDEERDALRLRIKDLKKVLSLAKNDELTEKKIVNHSDVLTIPEEKKNTTRRQARKICLLKSSRSIFDLLVEELKSFNFDVTVFETVESLTTAYSGLSVDLLIIDLAMLKVNKASRILELPETIKAQNAPLIVIGSDEDFPTRLAVAKSGARGYFVNPVDISELINKINHFFDKQNAEPGRVLIVDDDLQLACHYKLVLETVGIEVEFVVDPEELLNALETVKPELVLMDLNMPDISGRDLAGVIRQFKRYESLPIVFLSAETTLSTQLDALYHGADEFLTKPISNDALILTVVSRIQRARTLESLIKQDGLTGLLTHTNIKESADYELKRAKRTRSVLSFAMIDIDHFKSVNDNYGHSTGDSVIASLATLLKQRLRATDLIGRYGGEEFLVVLPECALEEAYNILDDIRTLFEKIQFHTKDKAFFSSISIGVSSTSQFLSFTPDEMIKSADKALYEAKHTGRNKTVKYLV